jgi:hypothetical protein
MQQPRPIVRKRFAARGPDVHVDTPGLEALRRANGENGCPGVRFSGSLPVPERAPVSGPTPRTPGGLTLRRPSAGTARRLPVASSAAPTVAGAG